MIKRRTLEQGLMKQYEVSARLAKTSQQVLRLYGIIDKLHAISVKRKQAEISVLRKIHRNLYRIRPQILKVIRLKEKQWQNLPRKHSKISPRSCSSQRKRRETLNGSTPTKKLPTVWTMMVLKSWLTTN